MDKVHWDLCIPVPPTRCRALRVTGDLTTVQGGKIFPGTKTLSSCVLQLLFLALTNQSLTLTLSHTPILINQRTTLTGPNVPSESSP